MTFPKALAGMVLGLGLLSAAQDQNGVYRVGGGVSAPRVLSRSDPAYTPEANAAKVEGTVLLSIVIGTDGMAHDVNVVKALGSGLDEQAVIAVQKWHFQPAEKDGQPVKARAQIEVNFKIK
jgi:TonB family protein